MPRIDDFMERSECAITSLRLFFVYEVSYQDIIDVLKAHPKLEHLFITIYSEHPRVYNEREAPYSWPLLAPILKHLHWPELPYLKNMELDFEREDIKGTEFAQIIQSRWTTGSAEDKTFESVIVRFDPTQVKGLDDKSFESHLGSLRKEGLRLHVDHHHYPKRQSIITLSRAQMGSSEQTGRTS